MANFVDEWASGDKGNGVTEITQLYDDGSYKLTYGVAGSDQRYDTPQAALGTSILVDQGWSPEDLADFGQYTLGLAQLDETRRANQAREANLSAQLAQSGQNTAATIAWQKEAAAQNLAWQKEQFAKTFPQSQAEYAQNLAQRQAEQAAQKEQFRQTFGLSQEQFGQQKRLDEMNEAYRRAQLGLETEKFGFQKGLETEKFGLQKRLEESNLAANPRNFFQYWNYLGGRAPTTTTTVQPNAPMTLGLPQTIGEINNLPALQLMRAGGKASQFLPGPLEGLQVPVGQQARTIDWQRLTPSERSFVESAVSQQGVPMEDWLQQMLSAAPGGQISPFTRWR